MARSLRTRLILGAVLWTLGLFGLLVVLHNEIMLRNPRLPKRLFASTFSHAPHLTVIAIVLTFDVAPLLHLGRNLEGTLRGDAETGGECSEAQRLVGE